MDLARCPLVIQDDDGNIINGASVEVRHEISGQPLAVPYSNRAGTAALGNPYVAADGADAGFHIAGGAYQIRVYLGPSGAPTFERIRRYVGIGTAQEVDQGTSFNPRYDLAFSSTGLLGDGEELPAYAVPVALTLPAGLPESLAFCDAAPTSQAIVTFKKKTGVGAWANVFTVTFAAGALTGTFTLAADAALAVNDRLRPFLPSPSDPTFEGFTATIVAIR